MSYVVSALTSGLEGVWRSFNNLKINTKIMGGFACMLLITVLTSGFALRSFLEVRSSVEAYGQRDAVVNIVREIDREFLDFHRRARDYASGGSELDALAADGRRTVLREKLASALDLIESPLRQAQIRHISELLDVYTGAFETVMAARRQGKRLVEEIVDPVGRELRARIEELREWTLGPHGNSDAALFAGEALMRLMEARLEVANVLGRGDATAKSTADKALGELETVIQTLSGSVADPGARKLIDEISRLLSQYADAFSKAAGAAATIQSLVTGEMKRVAENIGADAAEIKDSASAEEQSLAQQSLGLIARTQRFIFGLSFGALAFGMAFAWVIGRQIANPVTQIGQVLLELARGNRNIEVPFADRGDEVGDNARAAKTFKENLIRIERMEREQKEAEKRAEAQRKAALRKLADSFSVTVGNVVDTVSSAAAELEAAARTLTKAAESTEQLSGMAASASEQTSHNVRSVATATEEMSITVSEIGRQVQESSRMAHEAVTQAAQTDARMGELNDAAGRIGDVVKLITNVAEQTNLLALNATIEAARAGEAGRGFAVVAQEVKVLAAQTAKATNEIETQISDIQAATRESVLAIKAINATIARISDISAAIAAAVEEQSTTTRDIARNVQEAAQGTLDVASNITEVNKGASETGTASERVLNAARSLSSDSAHLRIEVEKFLASVRAA